ncbi:MAG: hypothetical protein ACK559_22750 [bacterium]
MRPAGFAGRSTTGCYHLHRSGPQPPPIADEDRPRCVPPRSQSCSR